MSIVETISANNIDSLARLVIEFWPDSDLEEMTKHYNGLLKSGPGTCFLLKIDLDYIGFIELSIRNDYVEGADNLPVAYIEGLFILPAYRDKGAATILIEKAERWAYDKGLRQICSDSELDNINSIDFHVAIGFKEISRIVCFAKNLD